MGSTSVHKVSCKVCRLLNLTVEWALRGVIKESSPSLSDCQGNWSNAVGSPVLSVGYWGSLHEDLLIQGR